MADNKTITFVKGTLPTIVWDPRRDRALVEFMGGLFKTSDPHTIKVLTEMGYKTVGDFPLGPPPDGFEHQKTSMAPPKPIADLTSSTLYDEQPAPGKQPDLIIETEATAETAETKETKKPVRTKSVKSKKATVKE